MKSKVVAVLETRTGAHLGELIARRGGIPMLAPALEEVPDVSPEALRELLQEWRRNPFDIVIFQTGVGTRGLFDVAASMDAAAQLAELLSRAHIVVRGPKPTAELNARGVRIDRRAATPFTTETVLACLADVQLNGARVLVQRYGDVNQRLLDALQARGAAGVEFATYRWALPRDTRPLLQLLKSLAAGEVDAVVFTSAVQVHHLFAVAGMQQWDAVLPGLLNRCVVASIGPVCSRQLAGAGVTVSLEASPPKLGPLMTALEARLSERTDGH